MSHDEEHNDVQPVDIATLKSILDQEQLEYRVEGEAIRTGFINAAIAIVIDTEADALGFEAIWRGQCPREDVAELLLACNERNQSTFAPTLRFFEGEGDDHLTLSAIRTLDITHGASFNQLGAFLVSSIDATLQAFDYLAATFPALVTWEDNDNELS